MFLGNCCEKKCEKSDTKECDYSKCKSSETKKECPHANKEESIITEKKDTTEKINTIEEDTNTEKPYLILVTQTEWVNGESIETQYYKRTSEKPRQQLVKEFLKMEPIVIEPIKSILIRSEIFFEERDTTLQIIE